MTKVRALVLLALILTGCTPDAEQRAMCPRIRNDLRALNLKAVTQGINYQDWVMRNEKIYYWNNNCLSPAWIWQ